MAAFMDLALYHPAFGYYARAARRSGRSGDFFTSVDVGPLFGELLAIQLAEMFSLIRQSPAAQSPSPQPPSPQSPSPQPPLDLIEAGAGNGRLAADILRAARAHHRSFYESIALHLVEASPSARAVQREVLGEVGERLTGSSDSMPDSIEGVIFANELLDALPVHQVVMRDDGLREVYVDCRPGPLDPPRPFESRDPGGSTGPALRLIEGNPSTPALRDHLDRVGARLEPGWRAEIGLRASEWVRDAARRLRRGFMILIDYGHEAEELYSVGHSSGTLTTFDRHRSSGAEARGEPAWLQDPGDRDITAHVDFTSIRAAAEAEGMTTIGFLDQTYFLLGLLESERLAEGSQGSLGSAANQLRTLVMPGGLGSTMKVLILGKNVGRPTLKGCSFKVRAT